MRDEFAVGERVIGESMSVYLFAVNTMRVRWESGFNYRRNIVSAIGPLGRKW